MSEQIWLTDSSVFEICKFTESRTRQHKNDSHNSSPFISVKLSKSQKHLILHLYHNTDTFAIEYNDNSTGWKTSKVLT